jgi:hypothetical protein
MSDLGEDERQLIRGLEALAHLDEGAPPELRVRLGAEFQRKVRAHPVRWLTVAAAAAVVVLAMVLSPTARQPQSTVSPDLASFIPLDSEPVNAGIVVRVRLPRSALLDEGGPGEVEADVLLGEDGLAHAVRFIQQP